MTSGQIVGYRRVSSSSQSLARQELPDVTGRIFEEKLTGARRDRPALQELLGYVRDGDEVHVHSIDRLARSLKDLEDIVAEIIGKGASVRFLKENLHFKPDQDSDAFQKLMFQMLGAFAEFERNMIKSRQAEGIKKAKADGKFKGKQPTIDYDLIIELSLRKVSPDVIAAAVGIGRASVFRIKKTVLPNMKEKEPLDARIRNLENELVKASGTLEAARINFELTRLKELHNRVWTIVYKFTGTTQREALKWLNDQGWSIDKIARNKSVDTDYVKYAIETANGDGLFTV